MQTLLRATCLCVLALCAANVAGAPDVKATASVITDSVAPVFEGGVGSTYARASLFAPVFVQSAPGVFIAGDTGGSGKARANIGSLGVSANAEQGLGGGTLSYYRNVVTSKSLAQFTLHDLMVTPLVASTSPFVSLSLRFRIDGIMDIPLAQGAVNDNAIFDNFPDQVFATARTQLLMGVTLNRPDFTWIGYNGGEASIRSATTNIGATSSVMLASGPFAGRETALQHGIPILVELSFLGVPVNEMLDLTVLLSATAETGVGFPVGGGLRGANASVEFDKTLTFATDTVATLPAGFTLNSPSGGIVNNVWTPAPVPLPGSLPLLAIGLLGLVRPRQLTRDSGA